MLCAERKLRGEWEGRNRSGIVSSSEDERTADKRENDTDADVRQRTRRRAVTAAEPQNLRRKKAVKARIPVRNSIVQSAERMTIPRLSRRFRYQEFQARMCG